MEESLVTGCLQGLVIGLMAARNGKARLGRAHILRPWALLLAVVVTMVRPPSQRHALDAVLPLTLLAVSALPEAMRIRAQVLASNQVSWRPAPSSPVTARNAPQLAGAAAQSVPGAAALDSGKVASVSTCLFLSDMM